MLVDTLQELNIDKTHCSQKVLAYRSCWIETSMENDAAKLAKCWQWPASLLSFECHHKTLYRHCKHPFWWMPIATCCYSNTSTRTPSAELFFLSLPGPGVGWTWDLFSVYFLSAYSSAFDHSATSPPPPLFEILSNRSLVFTLEETRLRWFANFGNV